MLIFIISQSVAVKDVSTIISSSSSFRVWYLTKHGVTCHLISLQSTKKNLLSDALFFTFFTLLSNVLLEYYFHIVQWNVQKSKQKKWNCSLWYNYSYIHSILKKRETRVWKIAHFDSFHELNKSMVVCLRMFLFSYFEVRPLLDSFIIYI